MSQTPEQAKKQTIQPTQLPSEGELNQAEEVKNPEVEAEFRPTGRGIAREVIMNLLVIVLLTVFVFLLIFQFFPAVSSLQSSRTQIDELISKYYIGNIPTEEDFENGQLKGYVSALEDPYSDYMTEEDNDQFQDDLNERYEGVGIRFEQTNQGINIVETIPGGPAEESGLEANDVLLEVDGQGIARYDLDEIAGLILGEAGTQVTLTVRRGDKILDFELTRQKIFTPLVTLEIEENIGIISITSFGESIDQEMLSVANEVVNNEEVNYLILDLRSNGGGVLGGAVDVSSYFLEAGQIVAKEQAKEETVEDKAESKEISLRDYPIVILTNGRTASASEIVAAALRDHRQVPLIGQKTFGKGVVQQIFKLNDGNFLRLTVAEWLTPNGNKIDGLGLEPDFELPAETNELELTLEYYDWENRQLNVPEPELNP